MLESMLSTAVISATADEVGMNRDQDQIDEQAMQLQKYRTRGNELAKKLGIDGEEALLRFCADKEQEVSARGTACLALGFFKYERAVPTLLQLADDPDLSLVVNATRALEMIADPRAFEPMLTLAKDATRVEVRNRAIDVLGMLGDSRAEETLVTILGDRREAESTRCSAADAIGGLPQHSGRAVPCLLEALKEPSALIRWTALNTLGLMGDQSVVPALQSCLSDKEIVPDLPEATTVANAAENALKNLKACSECAS
jgi:HEAT repeat protein